MVNARPTVTFQAVCDAEQLDIEQRRQKVGLPPEVEDNLVGLSLSGGGVRSACFAMGFVQSLHAKGLWKWIDYLSTVSGGGYIGAFLSSAIVQQEEVASQDNFPLREAPGSRQLPHVLRFIYGGNYLLNAWELANKYLIGLVLLNLTIFSALVALGALLALLWRSFDTHAFRERADMLDLNVDLYAAFWPFVFFAIGWLVAWALSYYRRGAEAPGRIARMLLHGTAVAAILGIALLLGNGDIQLPKWAGGSLDVSTTWWGSILGLVLGSLLPLVQPKRIIQSGISPRNEWERWIFGIVTTGMLVGVPVAVVGTLGRENISGYSDAPNRPLVRHDIEDLRSFSALLGAESPAALPTPQPLQLPIDVSPEIRRDARNLEEKRKAYDLATVNFKHTNEYCGYASVHYLYRAYYTLGWALGMQDNPAHAYWQAKQAQFAAADALCQAVETTLLPDENLFAALKQDRKARADAEKARTAAGGTAPAAKSASSGAARTALDKQLARAAPNQVIPQRHEIKQLNRLMLEERYPEIIRPRTEIRRSVCIAADQVQRAWIFGIAALAFCLAGAWVDLNATSMHGYYRNRLARTFVVPKNRKTRSVPLSELNTTDYGAPYHLVSASVGWFQRQLSQGSKVRRNGAIFQPGMVTSSSSAAVPAPSAPPAAPAAARDESWLAPTVEESPTANWVDSFLFSRRYCGSQATGYLDTRQYEGLIQGDLNRIDLAEAVALSGGAVSPGQVHNPFIAFLMFALNLRLGQWLPNPGRSAPKARPTVLPLLWHLRESPEDRPYCFVSDGGYCDNLGLLTLLRRRCRLILAVDAGQDAEHCFDDLSRAVRDARVHDGIRIVPVEGEKQDWIDGLQASDLNLKPPADKKPPICEKHFLLASIVYPDAPPGLLVYVKPSLDGDEPLELLQYRLRNRDFPHEPTSDQLFGPAQVESYRQLGYHIGMHLFRDLSQRYRQGGEAGNVTSRDLCEEIVRLHRRPAAAKPACEKELQPACGEPPGPPEPPEPFERPRKGK